MTGCDETVWIDVYKRQVYSSEFNAVNLPSGIYFYSLYIDGKEFATKKMTLIK